MAGAGAGVAAPREGMRTRSEEVTALLRLGIAVSTAEGRAERCRVELGGAEKAARGEEGEIAAEEDEDEEEKEGAAEAAASLASTRMHSHSPPTTPTAHAQITTTQKPQPAGKTPSRLQRKRTWKM